MILTTASSVTEPSRFRRLRKRLGRVLSAEETTSDGVVYDDIDAVAAASNEQL